MPDQLQYLLDAAETWGLNESSPVQLERALTYVSQVLMFQTSPQLTGLTLAVLPAMLIAFQVWPHDKSQPTGQVA